MLGNPAKVVSDADDIKEFLLSEHRASLVTTMSRNRPIGGRSAVSRDITPSSTAHTGIANDQLFCDIQQPGSILNLVQNPSPVDAVCITAGATKLVPKQMIKRQIIDSQPVNLWPIDLISTMLRLKKVKRRHLHHYECIRSLQRRESDRTLRGGKERFSSSEQILFLNYRRRKYDKFVSFDYVSTEMTEPSLAILKQIRRTI